MTKFHRQFIVCAGLAQVLAFVVYLAMAAYVIPFWDTLDWIDTYYASESVPPWLWQHHADVRQPVAKFLLWLDLRLFTGAFYPIVAVCFLGTFLCMIGIARLAHSNMRSPTGRALAVAVPFIFGFQSFTLPSYMETSLIQHVLVVVFLIGAAWPIIHAATGRPPPWALGAAAIGAILASLTFPNGLLAWPIVAWLAWRRGCAMVWPILFLVAGAVTASIYFGGYNWDGTTKDWTDLGAPLTVLRFVVEFLSVPWIRVPTLYPIGIGIGAAILVVGGLMAVRVGLRRRPDDPLKELALVLLTFVVGTAFMTAVARAGFLDLRTQGTRYGIYAAVAQLGVALYFLPLIDRARALTRRQSRVLAAVGLAIVISLASQQIVIGEKAAASGRDMVNVRDALQTGDRTPDILLKLYPDRDRAIRLIGLLERERLYGLGDTAE